MTLPLPFPNVIIEKPDGSKHIDPEGQQANNDALAMALPSRQLVGGSWAQVGGAGAPAFENGWANYGAPFLPARYRIDGLGYVHLSGSVKSGTAVSVIFTLPVGFRPAAFEAFPAAADPTGGRVHVFEGGGVCHVTGGNSFFSLGGISFLAEQ